MAFKMKGFNPGQGTGMNSAFKKNTDSKMYKANEDLSIDMTTGEVKSKKQDAARRKSEVTNTGKSWDKAYKDRDMKTYGKLTKDEYVTEAKRQKGEYVKTGKWDYKNAPKVEESEKGKKTTRVVETGDTKKTEVSKKRGNVIGDKTTTTTVDKKTGDVKIKKEKGASILEGAKTKIIKKKGDTITKSKVTSRQSGPDGKLGTADDKVKSKTRKKGGTGIGAAIKTKLAERKARRKDKKDKK